MALVSPCLKFHADNYNNYVIFRNSFFHLTNQQNLYAFYPHEYVDNFKYGPLFSVLMAPFSMLPLSLGCLLYLLTSASVLFLAIRSLPLTGIARNGFYWVCLMDFANNQGHFQTNGIIAALIILAFTYVQRDKDVWATLCIALGAFIKVYGLVGLAFFAFSRRKVRFLAFLAGWSVVFYLLPALFSSLQFINDSYVQWFVALAQKSELNAALGGFTDQSVIGFIRRLVANPDIPELPIMAAGFLLLVLPYLRISCHRDLRFRLLALACVLMFVVLFSTGSESPTYIILQCGVATWFCAASGLPVRLRGRLLLFVLVFSSLSPSDLFPGPFRDFYNAHSLRVVPCVIVWLTAIYEMLAYPWCARDAKADVPLVS